MLENTAIHPNIERVLVTTKQIEETVKKTAAEIDQRYHGEKLMVVGILKGAFIYLSDLVRNISTPHEISFLQASSYGAGVKSTNIINIRVDLTPTDLTNTHVLLVEDIVDSGNTLHAITGYFEKKGAKSVAFCTLLDKPSRRQVKMETEFHTIVIPDEFVVGYGLDYAEQYRHLPYIGVLKREIYED